MDLWNQAALRLFCRAAGDFLPARDFFLRFFLIEFYDTLFHRYRNDLIHTQLHRLFDHSFHAFPFGNALKQVDP